MKVYQGHSASPGLVMGQVSRLERWHENFATGPFNAEREQRLLENAVRTAQRELDGMADRSGPTEQAIFLFQSMMLEDEGFMNEVKFQIKAGISAAEAMYRAGNRYAEQLAAMEMMGVDPLRRIMAPRFAGVMISMPILALIFSAMGIFGAWVVGVGLIGTDNGAFWSQMQSSVDIFTDVLNGVIKSIVFGAAVGLVALFQGYSSRPTPDGVSRATTRTVVVSSLLVLGLDFIMTANMFSGL